MVSQDPTLAGVLGVKCNHFSQSETHYLVSKQQYVVQHMKLMLAIAFTRTPPPHRGPFRSDSKWLNEDDVSLPSIFSYTMVAVNRVIVVPGRRSFWLGPEKPTATVPLAPPLTHQSPAWQQHGFQHSPFLCFILKSGEFMYCFSFYLCLIC